MIPSGFAIMFFASALLTSQLVAYLRGLGKAGFAGCVTPHLFITVLSRAICLSFHALHGHRAGTVHSVLHLVFCCFRSGVLHLGASPSGSFFVLPKRETHLLLPSHFRLSWLGSAGAKCLARLLKEFPIVSSKSRLEAPIQRSGLCSQG